MSTKCGFANACLPLDARRCTLASIASPSSWPSSVVCAGTLGEGHAEHVVVIKLGLVTDVYTIGLIVVLYTRLDFVGDTEQVYNGMLVCSYYYSLSWKS